MSLWGTETRSKVIKKRKEEQSTEASQARATVQVASALDRLKQVWSPEAWGTPPQKHIQVLLGQHGRARPTRLGPCGPRPAPSSHPEGHSSHRKGPIFRRFLAL